MKQQWSDFTSVKCNDAPSLMCVWRGWKLNMQKKSTNVCCFCLFHLMWETGAWVLLCLSALNCYCNKQVMPTKSTVQASRISYVIIQLYLDVSSSAWQSRWILRRYPLQIQVSWHFSQFELVEVRSWPATCEHIFTCFGIIYQQFFLIQMIVATLKCQNKIVKIPIRNEHNSEQHLWMSCVFRPTVQKLFDE